MGFYGYVSKTDRSDRMEPGILGCLLCGAGFVEGDEINTGKIDLDGERVYFYHIHSRCAETTTKDFVDRIVAEAIVRDRQATIDVQADGYSN